MTDTHNMTKIDEERQEWTRPEPTDEELGEIHKCCLENEAEARTFQRNLDKIDRRIQKPNLPGYLKEDLWRLRNSLFDNETETIADLDRRLRYFDSLARKAR
jgi:septation ring formation regulator EzrA